MGEKIVIKLEERPIEWIYYKIKTMEDYDMRKLLSKELLSRELDHQSIDDEAFRIALSYQNYETLYNLTNSLNSYVAALAYQEYRNRIDDSQIKKHPQPKIKVKKMKRKKSIYEYIKER